MQNIFNEHFLKLLGNRVKELRVEKNMTQEDLGFLVGNSGKQIGRIERGEHNVTTGMIYARSKVLEVHIKDLFDFEI